MPWDKLRNVFGSNGTIWKIKKIEFILIVEHDRTGCQGLDSCHVMEDN